MYSVDEEEDIVDEMWHMDGICFCFEMKQLVFFDA